MNPPGKTTLSRMQRTAYLEAERIEISQDGRIRCGMQKDPLPGEVEKRDDFAGIVRLIDAIESDALIKETLTRRVREQAALRMAARAGSKDIEIDAETADA